MKRRRLKRKVRLGDPAIVRVRSPATSGYRWEFIQDASAWRLAKHKIVPSRGFGGDGEIEYWFEPLQRGTITIHGKLGRPWENNPIEAIDIVIVTE